MPARVAIQQLLPAQYSAAWAPTQGYSAPWSNSRQPHRQLAVVQHRLAEVGEAAAAPRALPVRRLLAVRAGAAPAVAGVGAIFAVAAVAAGAAASCDAAIWDHVVGSDCSLKTLAILCTDWDGASRGVCDYGYCMLPLRAQLTIRRWKLCTILSHEASCAHVASTRLSKAACTGFAVIVNCLLGAKCQAVPRHRAMHACRGLQNLWDLKTRVTRALQADLLPAAASLQSCSCYRPTHELRVLQVCVHCSVCW